MFCGKELLTQWLCIYLTRPAIKFCHFFRLSRVMRISWWRQFWCCCCQCKMQILKIFLLLHLHRSTNTHTKKNMANILSTSIGFHWQTSLRPLPLLCFLMQMIFSRKRKTLAHKWWMRKINLNCKFFQRSLMWGNFLAMKHLRVSWKNYGSKKFIREWKLKRRFACLNFRSITFLRSTP